PGPPPAGAPGRAWALATAAPGRSCGTSSASFVHPCVSSPPGRHESGRTTGRLAQATGRPPHRVGARPAAGGGLASVSRTDCHQTCHQEEPRRDETCERLLCQRQPAWPAPLFHPEPAIVMWWGDAQHAIGHTRGTVLLEVLQDGRVPRVK